MYTLRGDVVSQILRESLQREISIYCTNCQLIAELPCPSIGKTVSVFVACMFEWIVSSTLRIISEGTRNSWKKNEGGARISSEGWKYFSIKYFEGPGEQFERASSPCTSARAILHIWCVVVTNMSVCLFVCQQVACDVVTVFSIGVAVPCQSQSNRSIVRPTGRSISHDTLVSLSISHSCVCRCLYTSARCLAPLRYLYIPFSIHDHPTKRLLEPNPSTQELPLLFISRSHGCLHCLVSAVSPG